MTISRVIGEGDADVFLYAAKLFPELSPISYAHPNEEY